MHCCHGEEHIGMWHVRVTTVEGPKQEKNRIVGAHSTLSIQSKVFIIYIILYSELLLYLYCRLFQQRRFHQYTHSKAFGYTSSLAPSTPKEGHGFITF